MSNFRNRFKTNVDAEENGQPVDFGDGVEVTVRRLGAKFVQEAKRKLDKPYANLFKTNPNYELPQNIQEAQATKLLAEAIVVSWKGVTDEDGTELECTVENKMKIFSDRTLVDFKNNVLLASASSVTFSPAEAEEAVKN